MVRPQPRRTIQMIGLPQVYQTQRHHTVVLRSHPPQRRRLLRNLRQEKTLPWSG